MTTKSFELVDFCNPQPSTSIQKKAHTNWKLCMLCQKDTKETLTRPSLKKNEDIAKCAYTSLAQNLRKFDELGELQGLTLGRLDEGQGIEAAMFANNAIYHQSCKLRYNNTKLQRSQKRALAVDINPKDLIALQKRTRSQVPSNGDTPVKQMLCFFCEKEAGADGLHEATTFQIDSRVRACARMLEDAELLARLSPGDMVALEAKYHKKCLVALYNRARKTSIGGTTDTEEDRSVLGRVFAELVMYINETRLDESKAPVFKLADLARLYESRMAQFGVQCDERTHTTRLKQRLLAQFPDLRAQKKGRDIYLVFDEDLGAALTKACELDTESDALHLAHAAQIVRRYIFDEAKPFSELLAGSPTETVPRELLTLVSMILEGPSIKHKENDSMSPATFSIAQLIKFNAVKHTRATPASKVRHARTQETPVPIYIGLMLHSQTRNKEVVDRLSHLGISISYDRVLRLSAELGDTVCKQFHRDQLVCPLKMKAGVFTTAAVDNIDHNPSSTTSKESFHGTSISLVQHPRFTGEGTERSNVNTGSYCYKESKTVGNLPNYYTDILPVTDNIKRSPVPTASVLSLNRSDLKQGHEEEYNWLENARQSLDGTTETFENTSWSAYHASRQPTDGCVMCPTALLPLFLESAHTVAMIKHAMDVVTKAVEHLNEGQTPVIVFDQPLFALAKQIQWKWPEKYGEDRLVVMLGGLHIELAVLKTLGDWLKGSGWVQVLVQADIASFGIADSFLKASHIARTRRVHQITACALYILQQRAYEHYINLQGSSEKTLQFSEWCDHKSQIVPQFHYWAIVMELEICLLVYVRSLRQANFTLYLDALTELVPWFFAFDHTNYARWVPVHLRDMAELPNKHPHILKEFNAGKFTVQKSIRIFSSIPIDQAHEQNNAIIKGDGGAVGLTDNPAALRRWMVAGPEVARLIGEFHSVYQNCSRQVDTRHHDQIPSVQAAFGKDVSSLVGVIEELGNPFLEESTDLLVLDTKEIANLTAIETLQNAHFIGQQQFESFTKECLIDRTRSLYDTIRRNKLQLFSGSNTKNATNIKQQIVSIKNDVALFSRLYIGCQTRGGNIDMFFEHENQACPPALSDDGRIRLGVKSDLLTCLEEHYEPTIAAPTASCVILDGAAIVQMLKPAHAKTFEEYAHKIFIPYILSYLKTYTRLDLVWDKYIIDSLKSTARLKRGIGVRQRVVGKSSIPGNWQNFLRVDSNKTELFLFLSQALLEEFTEENKQLVITKDNIVLAKPPMQNIDAISPCNHEESDTRMFLHSMHASQHGHSKILIRTVDTDVVVLAVFVVRELPTETELWICFGTGKNLRYLAAHQIAHSLGPARARALPMFHAITGCDTVSSFAGRGKKKAWAMWKSLPELTDALIALSCAPATIPGATVQVIERFVILLYDRTSTCTELNKARKKLFVRNSNVQHIPPTKAALEQHIKRAAYVGGYVWGQTLIPNPVLPPPTSWGWTKRHDGLYEPYWTTLPEASTSCLELVMCRCTKNCEGHCKCKKSALPCTALCACDGQC